MNDGAAVGVFVPSAGVGTDVGLRVGRDDGSRVGAAVGRELLNVASNDDGPGVGAAMTAEDAAARETSGVPSNTQ